MVARVISDLRDRPQSRKWQSEEPVHHPLVAPRAGRCHSPAMSWLGLVDVDDKPRHVSDA